MSANSRRRTPGVERLSRVDLPVRDLTRMADFYARSLAFVAEGGAQRADDCDFLMMRLGRQRIRLLQFDRPGRPYPAARTSADTWFQHLAIVVSDMNEAYRRLADAPGVESISQGGPQILPPNTGRVAAFKFRDPDGHPLELLHFPGGAANAFWSSRGGELFLGFDHSAICVGELDRSLKFYVGLLGLTLSGQTLNSGPEQSRLDALVDPVVDVLALAPAAQATPHVELLHYRAPRHGARPEQAPAPHDVAASRLVFESRDLAGLASRLRDASAPCVAEETDERGLLSVLVRDPDDRLVSIERGGDERS
ncbi:MAG TPA: VOC family protein [Beijerinckiaceae bacterium]|nr:VOC family protein [Beijerinckiaceae bacterium]